MPSVLAATFLPQGRKEANMRKLLAYVLIRRRSFMA